MQTVKIQTGFSEKLSQNYNSNQFSVSLEMECHINGSTQEIETAAAKLFDLCRKIVQHEKSGQSAQTSLNPPPNQTQFPSNGNGDRPASAKQIAAIYAIGKSVGLNKSQIEQLAGVNLSSKTLLVKDASKVIEFLKQKQAA